MLQAGLVPCKAYWFHSGKAAGDSPPQAIRRSHECKSEQQSKLREASTICPAYREHYYQTCSWLFLSRTTRQYLNDWTTNTHKEWKQNWTPKKRTAAEETEETCSAGFFVCLFVGWDFVWEAISLLLWKKMGNGTYQLIEDCEATNKALYKFYAAVMIVIFILALPLNASVLHLFIFKLKFWKSNTNNVFLFNLVLADILLLFCLPIKAYNFIQGERRSVNDTVCKAMLFMLFLNRGASIAFLTVTSIDRYFNVVHPGRKNLLRALKKSPQISILIWLFLLPLTIPTMLKTFECCNSHKSSNDDTLIKVNV